MEWHANMIDDDAGLARILREARTVAVLGAKGDAGQPAYYVPAYLKAHGYRVLPVNPTRVGERILGESVVATLADLRESPDVVEIFRRPQFLQAHAAEIVRMPRPPAVVWFQLGIRNDGAAETLARAGIRVVQDRCMMPEHRRLLGAA
jgi:predicted CoA-binding protein